MNYRRNKKYPRKELAIVVAKGFAILLMLLICGLYWRPVALTLATAGYNLTRHIPPPDVLFNETELQTYNRVYRACIAQETPPERCHDLANTAVMARHRTDD